jgi:hypothetical protein
MSGNTFLILRHTLRKRWIRQAVQSAVISVADELAKPAKLKKQGILSEAEFNQMKQELFKKL